MATLINDTSPQVSRRNRQIVRLVVGLVLIAVILYLIQREVDWRAAIAYLRNIDLLWFFIALLAILLNNLFKALRWRFLFPLEQDRPAPGEAFGALMAGQLLNFMLPLRSGDISRAYFMGRYRQASTATAFGTIGAEKLVDLLVMGGLFAIVVSSFVLPAWLDTGSWGVWLQVGLGFIIWLGILAAMPRAQLWLQQAGQRWPAIAPMAMSLSRVLQGFKGLRERANMPRVWGWTVVVWFAAIAATYAMLLALHLPATILTAILVMVIVQGGISVPVVPGQVGVFEGLAILALTIVGVAAEPALAFGLALHVAVLIFPVLVGLPWLLRQLQAKTS